MHPSVPKRVSVFADFSHTAMIPKGHEGKNRIFHEVTLRDQVSGRLSADTQQKFVREATAGWELSQQLKQGPPEQKYHAWLDPFTGLLTEDDIKADIERHWMPNNNFGNVVREFARVMGYKREERMPLTFVSGALTPMVRIAMETHFGSLLSDVVTLDIRALEIEMVNGVFNGNLLSIDRRVYGGATSYGDGDYLLIGDHYMRPYGFGDHLVVIYEPNGACDNSTVLEKLNQYLG